MNQLSQTEIDAILFPPIAGWFLAAKIFCILISVSIIIFIIYVWFTTPWLKRLVIWDLMEFFTFRPYVIKKIDKQWMKILQRLESELETEYKLSVIEADLLLNDVMKRLGNEGKNLNEKLERVKPGVFSQLQTLKEADQVYQNLVYDTSYHLTQSDAKRIVAEFERALSELEAF
ncbi:MAG TPA: hypothetical protein P5080_03385 [Candidatus Paceibacterota bacterium]|nr:hypothetical protein [Candidatus Pacearchaeota archaeon]HRZ51011.1 hypothetical protein [Candidatus Paceibacterota bacterium]HSA36732.1 hypothetical protein [Candidatus Paceibacterota bacterium]